MIACRKKIWCKLFCGSLLMILLSCVPLIVKSQITVSAGFSQDSVIIGDEIAYTLTIKTKPGIRVLGISGVTLDSIISGYQTQKIAQQQQDTTAEVVPQMSDFDVTDWGRFGKRDDQDLWKGYDLSFDTTILGNELLLENTVKFRFWEPGPQFITNPPVVYTNGDSTSVVQPEANAQIFIAPPFDIVELEQDSIDISPIKPIIKEKKNWRDFLIYLIPLGAILLLGFVFLTMKWVEKRKAAQVVEVEEIKIPAHIIAGERLEKLSEDQLWQKGEIKEYQSRLTFIIREYLENRYEIPALESTTEEITEALAEKDFDSEDEQELKNILQVADLVKFAKMTPQEELHQQFLDKAHSFVDKTKTNDEFKMPSREEIEKQTSDSEHNLPKVEIIKNNSVRTKIATSRAIQQTEPQIKQKSIKLSGKNSPNKKFAKWYSRIIAYGIDSLVVLIVFLLIITPLGYFFDLIGILIAFPFMLIFILYYQVYLESKTGQTWGKKIMRIKVINENGSNISLKNSFFRNWAKGFSFSFIIPALVYFFNDKNQTLHDKIMKTIVVHRDYDTSKDLIDNLIED